MWPTKTVRGGLAELYSWVLQGKQKYLHHVLMLCSKQWFRDLIFTFEPWRSEEIGSSANRKEYIHRIPPGSIIYRHFLSKYAEKSYGINTLSMCKTAKMPPGLKQGHCHIQISSCRAFKKPVILVECLLHWYFLLISTCCCGVFRFFFFFSFF